MESIVFKIALIGAVGIGAQWAAWRFGLPSVVLLAVAGLVAGPVTGYLDPPVDFGDIYRPLVAIAVAIILFEGGLTLRLREFRETPAAVRRMIVIGGPVTFLLASLAAHFIAGLTWPPAIVLAAILVVTGPTVILPLLRSTRLQPRPAAVLRWEGIVNDPIGAILAVLSFEVLVASHEHGFGGNQIVTLALGIVGSVAVGVAGGMVLVRIFQRGWVPEFLKSPMLLSAVLLGYEAGNLLIDEGGLLAVTVMGVVVGNSRLANLDELRRFKEAVTVLLVSGVFILLTASIRLDLVERLDWRAILFVAAILFVVRPVSVWLATVGTELNGRERFFIGWIAPRGVVAVAVSGLFGAALLDAGHADGERLVALAFVVVMATIVLHGFTIGILARRLGLVSAETPGVLLIGSAPWTADLAAKIAELGLPVMIADTSWNGVRQARMAGISTFHGDILSEVAEHTIDFNQFGFVLAATSDDSYNALVAANFGPEMGRTNVLTIHPGEDYGRRWGGGFRAQTVFDNLDYWEVVDRTKLGWVFSVPTITAERGLSDMAEAHAGDFIPLLVRHKNGKTAFFTQQRQPDLQPGDTVLAFVRRGPTPRVAESPAEASQPGPEPSDSLSPA